MGDSPEYIRLIKYVVLQTTIDKITDSTATLYLLRWGVVFQQSDAFCLAWGACYSYTSVWGTFDWLFHYTVPIFILFISNILLLRRFVWHPTPQQRRMILQLTLLSLLHLSFMFPEIIIGVIEALWLPTFALDVEINYLYYSTNFINQFLPFIIITSLPGMRQELSQWFRHVRRFLGGAMRIHPFLMGTTS